MTGRIFFVVSNVLFLYILRRRILRPYGDGVSWARAGRSRMRGFQTPLNRHCERVRAAEHAPRDPFRLHERRHGLAEIVERGCVVFVRPTAAERASSDGAAMRGSKSSGQLTRV